MRSLFPPWWFEHPYACPCMARNSERLERPTRVVLKKGGLDIELARCQGPYSCDHTMRNFVCTLELRLLCKMMNPSFHSYRVNDFHGSMHQTLLLLTLLIKNINMSLLVAACAGRRCRQAEPLPRTAEDASKSEFDQDLQFKRKKKTFVL